MTLAAAAAITCALGATAARASSYFTDFESGVGLEWSSTTRSSTASFTNFLGRFANHRVNLTLDTIAGAEYRLTYDFFAIDSWDGISANWGHDYFNVHVNDEEFFRAAFSNGANQDWSQTVAGRPTEGGPGVNLGFNGSWSDSIYRGMSVDFLATSSVTTISFFGQGLQGVNDESWGIDNVGVSMLSVPAPGGAALAACLAFGVAGRRTRPSRPLATERLR